MSYVSIYIDMGEIDTEDMVEELVKRWKRMSEEQKKKVRPFITEETDFWEPNNLDHKMKFELFLNHIDDYFYTEFEKRITGKVENDANVIFNLPEKFIRL